MHSLRRACSALRLSHVHGTISSNLPKQTVAAMATNAEGSNGDSRVQIMLKALDPQVVEDVEMTPEEMAEAEQR